MTAGQVSDYIGAAVLLDELPKAQWLLGDRGYDVDWFRDALQEKGIKPCIPGRKSRNEPIKPDKRRYRIEIMFGHLNDWRRVATRYDRCPCSRAFSTATGLQSLTAVKPMTSEDPPDRFLKLEEVKRRVGLGKSMIYR